MPLLSSTGRLSKVQISRGYSLLQELSSTLQEIAELSKQDEDVKQESKGPPTATRRSTRTRRSTASKSPQTASKIRKLKASLKTLSSEFYTLIPHDFGRSLPPPVDSMDEVKRKIDLLEVLSNVEISQQLQQEKKRNNRAAESERVNPLDAQFKLLNVAMEPLAVATDEYRVIERYIVSSSTLSCRVLLNARSVLLQICRDDPRANAHPVQAQVALGLEDCAAGRRQVQG